MDTEGEDKGQDYSPNQVIFRVWGFSLCILHAIIVTELKDHVNRAYEEGGSEDLNTEKVKRNIFLAL